MSVKTNFSAALATALTARLERALDAAERGDVLEVDDLLLVVDARQSLRRSDRDFLLWLDREAGVPLHVVMSKCDLVRREELARRYALLGASLRELQLRHYAQPHLMVSSKTGAGVELLRERGHDPPRARRGADEHQSPSAGFSPSRVV